MDGSDRIIPIDELPDFQVVEGDPDVRGWDVLSADGRTIGEVNNLLVDVEAMKVRYLDVDLNRAETEADSRRHILIPIGYARLDEADDRIFLDSLEAGMVPEIPEYRDEVITRDYESTLRVYFDAGFADRQQDVGQDAASDFYTNDLYSSDRFFETRRNPDGRRKMMQNGHDENYEAMPEQGEDRHQLAEPRPAFIDSGSYGASARVARDGFGPEIVRDGELDGLGRMPGARDRIRAEGGHFGSGWSDEEIVRAPTGSKRSERLRGL